MSETQHGEDWWLATDGKWYPATSHPSNWAPGTEPSGLPIAPTAAAIPTPPFSASAAQATSTTLEPTEGSSIAQGANPLLAGWRLSQGSSQLTSAVVGLGVIGILAAVAAIGLAVQTATEADRFYKTRAGSLAESRAFENWEAADGNFFGAFFGTYILWGLFTVLSIFWLYRAYRTVDATQAAGRKWSSGWAIAGFFVPLANLFVPFLVAAETSKIAAASKSAAQSNTAGSLVGWERRPMNLAVLLWWL